MGEPIGFDKAGKATLFLLAGLAFAAGGTPAPANAQSPPPHEQYRTLHTEHFRVTFPEGLEDVAGRAAERAESAYAALREGFLPEPAGPIDVLLTDHVDLSNAFARVTPSNRIVVWLSPPLDGLGLSHFDEWLELVLTHELVHIFHLDYVGPLGRAARTVFGRAPRRWPFFVGSSLPGLAVEGIAVHLESQLTEGGRLHGTFQEAMVRGHALDGGVERVDEALGESPLWPGGNRRYAYGSLFFVYLAERYGDEAVNEFLRHLAHQWVPFRLDAAARRAFGESFQSLWEEWRAETKGRAEALREEAADGAVVTETEPLTRGGRIAFHAAPHPGDPERVAYLRSDGRSDTRLVVLEEGRERTISRWNGVFRPVWTPDGDLLAPQLEFVDRYRLRSDLYWVDGRGNARRLTRGLRVSFADASPRDGRIVAVAEEGGRNRLLLLDGEGEVLRVLRAAEEGVLWSYPRWSPDGERIAVVRWRAGGWTGIVLLDGEGRTLAEVTEDRSLNTAPAWSPDGRFLLWSSDRTGIMNVHVREVTEAAEGEAEGAGGVELGELRKATRLLTAGNFPAVSADGRWLYVSVLRGDGWELERLPFDPASWTDPGPADPRFREGGHVMEERHRARADGPVTPYSAWSTLRPRYWLPLHASPRRVAGTEVLPRAFGFETSGADLLGRHGYRLEITAPLRDPGSRLEARGRYSWGGLGNPVLFVEGSQIWRDPFGLEGVPEEGAAPDTLFHVERERAAGLGAELRHQRFRRAATLTVSGRLIAQDRSLLEEDGAGELVPSPTYRLRNPSSDLVEGRVAVSVGTARAFPFSVSAQEGVSVAVALRERREVAVPDTLRGVRGFDGSLRDVVGLVNAFKGVPGPGYASHVFALRGAVGSSWGPGAGNRHFPVGGGGGGGAGTLGFTYEASRTTFPVRGFPAGALRGRRAWGASAEWRVPLGILHRGVGAWPLHLDRLAGGVFVEAAGAERVDEAGAAAWTTLASTGVEVGLFRSFLFQSPSFLRAGVAVPFRGGRDPSVYLGFGWGF